MTKILIALLIAGTVITTFSTHGDKVAAAEPTTEQLMNDANAQMKEAERQMDKENYEGDEDDY